MVDDDGRGYVDNGEDEWSRKHKYGDSDESDSGDDRKRKKGNDKKPKKVKPEHQIGALFANQAKKPPPPKREVIIGRRVPCSFLGC